MRGKQRAVCGRLAETDECKECRDHFERQGHHPSEVRCYQMPWSNTVANVRSQFRRSPRSFSDERFARRVGCVNRFTQDPGELQFRGPTCQLRRPCQTRRISTTSSFTRYTIKYVVWLTGHSRVPCTCPCRPISGCSPKLFAASQTRLAIVSAADGLSRAM